MRRVETGHATRFPGTAGASSSEPSGPFLRRYVRVLTEWLRMGLELHAMVPVLLVIICLFSIVMLGVEGTRVHRASVSRAHIQDAIIAGKAAVLVGSAVARDATMSSDDRTGLLEEGLRPLVYGGRGIPSAEQALATARLLVGTDLPSASEALSTFQLKVALEAFHLDSDNTFAPAFMSASVGAQAYVNARSGWDLLHKGELDGPSVRHARHDGASTLRLHAAGGLDILCDDWFGDFRRFVEGSGVSFCLPTVGAQVAQAVGDNPLGIDLSILPPSTRVDVNTYSRAVLEAYGRMLQRVIDAHDDHDYGRGGRVRIGLLCVVIVIGLLGCIGSLLLIQKQRTFLREQEDIESEFQCSASGVRMRRLAIRSLKDVSGKIAVLQPNEEAYGPVPYRQIELSVRRAAAPLAKLHPFVPLYMFTPSGITSHVDGLEVEVMRNSTLLDTLDERLPSGVDSLLNLTPTVNSTSDAIYLLISLATFNKNVAVLDDSPIELRVDREEYSDASDDDVGEAVPLKVTGPDSTKGGAGQHITTVASLACNMLFIVTRCVAHFGGAVVQVSHDCVVAQFMRPEDVGDDAKVVGTWEHSACHCAFAIQKLCSSQPRSLVSRMALVSGRAVYGSTQFHVSRMYTAMSPALLLGLRLLPLGELHGCDIITEAGVVNRIPNRFLTRPIHLLHPLDISVRNGGPCDPITVYQMVLEEPDPEDDTLTPEELEAIEGQQVIIKESVRAWERVWAGYDKVARESRPSHQQIEQLYVALAQFKLFRISGERDAAYEVALGVVKQLAFDNGVPIPTVEDE